MDMVIDVHTHTVASGHAYSTVKEYVQSAKQKGITHFAITDHGPAMPGASGLFHFYNLNTIPKYMDGVRIYKGIELNIIDKNGNHDYTEAMLHKLDIVIASLHTPCIKSGTREENTTAAIEIMKNPHVNILGHPGDSSFPINIEPLLKAAMETKTILEINNKSLEPGSLRDDRDTVRQIALACKAANYPIVLGSDAHIDLDIGKFNYCNELLKEINMPHHLVLNTDVLRFERTLGLI